MRRFTLIAVVLILLGCDRHYKIHIHVRDNKDIPLENVHVLAESVNRKLKLDIGHTDANGDIRYGQVGISELIFEFRKDGYRNVSSKFTLSNEEPANYDVTLEEIESDPVVTSR